jgi:4-amino-4-deoxy-L-arabinose transferase-like glycosyltransferase
MSNQAAAINSEQKILAVIDKWLRVLGVVASVFVMLLFVVTALRRLRYPYELEQLEGYNFLSALRVFRGQTLYPRPSLEFVPYMYPPGYFYVCAALGRLLGMSIKTMRVASILSTLGCFAAIYGLVWSEVRRHMPGILAAGLYAGCYVICEEWFDLGRLDSLFVLLVLLAIYATRRWHPAIAAGLWILAFQTKQSILPVAFIMLCCNWREVRRTVIGVTTLVLGAVASVAWLNRTTHSWYSFYVFAVPKANADIKLRTLLVFWPVDMLRPLLLALMVIVAAVVLTRPSFQSRVAHFYLAACSIVPLCWWIRAHAGSAVNALMPIYALVAVLFGIALARVLAWLPTVDPRLAQVGSLLLLVGVVAQESAGIYNPGDYVPPAGEKESIAAVVAEVRSISGEVYVTQQPYYEWLAGKPTHADLVSINDAMRPTGSPAREELREEIQTALAQHRFTALVMDDPTVEGRIDEMTAAGQNWEAYYNVQKAVPGAVPGTRPDWLMVHLPPTEAGSTP